VNFGQSAGGFDTTYDFLVLKGGQRSPSVLMDNINLSGVRYMIRDQVTGRNVRPPDAPGLGLAQAVCRLPTEYEAVNSYDGTNTVPNYVPNRASRLVIGNTAIYSFVPPSNGWYRIMGMATGVPRIGGNVIVSSLFESSAFEVDVLATGGSTAAQINVTRPTSDNGGSFSPYVTQVRAGAFADPNGNRWPFVDINVSQLRTDAFDGGLITLGCNIFDNSNLLSSYGRIQLLTPTAALTRIVPHGCTLLQCVTNSLTR
jgi:hypothetical protein